MKIALIAGGGDLPHNVIAGALAAGHEVYVAALSGDVAASDFTVQSRAFGIAEFGKMTKAFRKFGATHVCFAGNVQRPDFNALKPDFKGWFKVPGALQAARKGDDSLLRYVLGIYEKEGFTIIPPQDLCAHLLLPVGVLGDTALEERHKEDALKACEIASATGALDIGQGAVVCRGLVLAVEAQEGTDSMLERVVALPQNIKGRPDAREGVLAKMIKPGQEVRVDLPTIGLKTVELADRAGLAGIVAEGGGAFVIDREAVVKAADAAGLFIAGLPPRAE